VPKSSNLLTRMLKKYFVDSSLLQNVINKRKKTRNSAIADKPRDAFVQMQWRGWSRTRYNMPLPYALPFRIWSLCVKVCTHKYRRTPKLGSDGTPLSWDGRRGWPQITRLSRTCYHVKFGSSATKGVRINTTESTNWERWGPPPCSKGVADP